MIGFVKGLFEWLKCEFINVQIRSLSVLMLKAFLLRCHIIVFCFPLPTAAPFPSPPPRPIWPLALQGRSAGHCKLSVWYCCCVALSHTEGKLRAGTRISPVARRWVIVNYCNWLAYLSSLPDNFSLIQESGKLGSSRTSVPHICTLVLLILRRYQDMLRSQLNTLLTLCCFTGRATFFFFFKVLSEQILMKDAGL